MNKLERWTIGPLLTIAVLTFFFPLATVHVPVLGDITMSGYDSISKTDTWSNKLHTIGGLNPEDLIHESQDNTPIANRPSPVTARLTAPPLSVKTIRFIPIDIIASLACALIALLTCLYRVKPGFAKVFVTFGCVASATAIIHLTVANSDLHSWLAQQMTTDQSPSADPLLGLVSQVVQSATNAVQLKAGTGLYVLAASMLLATVLIHTGILSSPADPSLLVQTSLGQGNQSRSRYFFVLGAVTIAILAAAGLFLKYMHEVEPSIDNGTPVQVKDASGNFDSELALGALYGPVDSVSHTAVWAQPSTPPKDFSQFSQGPLTVRIVSTLSTTQDGKETKYIISAARQADYGCHGCWDALGAAKFINIGSTWELVAFNPYAAEGPGYNANPKVNLIKIGQDNYGVSWKDEDGGQGANESDEQIIAAVGSWIGEVLDLKVAGSYDNGECSSQSTGCYSYSAKAQFVRGSNPDFFDIKVTTAGTKANGDYSGVVSANGTKTYSLVGHAYR